MQSTHVPVPRISRGSRRSRSLALPRLSLHRYIALVIAAAVGSLILPPTWYQPAEVWLPAFVLLTALSTALEFVAVPLPRGGVLSVATITHVATILLVPAPFAALSIGVAVMVEEVARRADRVKALFNVASFVLTASVASLAVGVLGDFWAIATVSGTTPIGELKLFLLIAAAGAVYNVVNSVLTAGVISKAADLPFVYLVRVNTRNTGLSEMGGTMVGGLFALIWTVQPLWTALLVLPAAVISRSLEQIRQLETETRSAVRSIAQIIDHRDQTTFHHSERVATYAVALARELNLPEDEVELIEQAAVVHDLGKVGVPDAVLLKPGPLTESERALMSVHTEIGARILDNFQMFRSGAEIVLHHHESWDGTGYPGRLAGEAIPLGARVVAVADSFDAMTSGRPYRAALPVEEALDRLRRGAGVQWDPMIVGAFIKLVMSGTFELAGARTAHAPEPAPSGALEPPSDEVLDERLRQELRDLDHPAALVAGPTRQ